MVHLFSEEIDGERIFYLILHVGISFQFLQIVLFYLFLMMNAMIELIKVSLYKNLK